MGVRPEPQVLWDVDAIIFGGNFCEFLKSVHHEASLVLFNNSRHAEGFSSEFVPCTGGPSRLSSLKRACVGSFTVANISFEIQLIGDNAEAWRAFSANLFQTCCQSPDLVLSSIATSKAAYLSDPETDCGNLLSLSAGSLSGLILASHGLSRAAEKLEILAFNFGCKAEFAAHSFHQLREKLTKVVAASAPRNNIMVDLTLSLLGKRKLIIPGAELRTALNRCTQPAERISTGNLHAVPGWHANGPKKLRANWGECNVWKLNFYLDYQRVMYKKMYKHSSPCAGLKYPMAVMAVMKELRTVSPAAEQAPPCQRLLADAMESLQQFLTGGREQVLKSLEMVQERAIPYRCELRCSMTTFEETGEWLRHITHDHWTVSIDTSCFFTVIKSQFLFRCAKLAEDAGVFQNRPDSFDSFQAVLNNDLTTKMFQGASGKTLFWGLKRVRDSAALTGIAGHDAGTQVELHAILADILHKLRLYKTGQQGTDLLLEARHARLTAATAGTIVEVALRAVELFAKDMLLACLISTRTNVSVPVAPTEEALDNALEAALIGKVPRSFINIDLLKKDNLLRLFEILGLQVHLSAGQGAQVSSEELLLSIFSKRAQSFSRWWGSTRTFTV
eukprot:TRINITY_DN967_c0_g2_i13.p1 TRINITY_DN967_c0_g2~~TRINITY_DN967_c0_g2_i13.p1  ORF type:complete len:617 (+),score=88.67 TRINITY_DN967_c0_g2_i13:386-2236(+)